MDTRSKTNAEFRNEVCEILARQESKFDKMNATLQTILAEIQALRVSRSTHSSPPEIDPFHSRETSHSPQRSHNETPNDLHHLEKLADVKAVAQGAYPQAERCRLSLGLPELLTTAPNIAAALHVTGNFGFQPCSHGDFLGAILGTGITREKLGDIILQGEKAAQVLNVLELVDFLVTSLEKVGNVSVSCTKMPLLALEYEEPKTTTFKTIGQSLGVDANHPT